MHVRITRQYSTMDRQRQYHGSAGARTASGQCDVGEADVGGIEDGVGYSSEREREKERRERARAVPIPPSAPRGVACLGCCGCQPVEVLGAAGAACLGLPARRGEPRIRPALSQPTDQSDRGENIGRSDVLEVLLGMQW